jgi:hypothetical protein
VAVSRCTACKEQVGLQQTTSLTNNPFLPRRDHRFPSTLASASAGQILPQRCGKQCGRLTCCCCLFCSVASIHEWFGCHERWEKAAVRSGREGRQMMMGQQHVARMGGGAAGPSAKKMKPQLLSSM